MATRTTMTHMHFSLVGRRIWSRLRASRCVRVCLAVTCVLATLAWLRCGPLPAGLLDDTNDVSTEVFDRHGERLYEARSGLGTRSERLRADALPRTLAMATLAAEDVRFHRHVGIDPIAVARAAWRNMVSGRVVQGGSTITQQVAKLLVRRRASGAIERGWNSKVHEAVIALRLEHRVSKDEILALYLNLAPYGNQIEGAERAARAYFDRPSAMLTAAEAAFLAALPQQPTTFNPWREPARARQRQRRVLVAMAAHGWLSRADFELAIHERLTLAQDRSSQVAPHFVARVLAERSRPFPRRIETTIDATLQRTVQGIIEARRRDLDRHRASNVAVAVLDNHTGEWLAWEGSGNYASGGAGGAIDGVTTPRQPGSALKPFTYAAAFERGISPARVLADVPSQFPTAKAGVLYSPQNYDGQFRGPLLIRAALAGSENVPAVALASEIGVPAVARLLRRAGLTTLDHNPSHYGLGLTLGNAEVRLDELVAAYAMFARGGESVATRSVRSADGSVPARQPSERLVSERTAFWIADILADAEARAYIFGRGGSLEFPFTVAAKTGTSQSYHDNWALGFTRDVTVGVWVGNFDRTPLRNSTGVSGAGPIFHDVMLAAIERSRGSLPIGDTAAIVAVPPDVRQVELCAHSGMAPHAACPSRTIEWMPVHASIDRCTWHHASDRGVVTVWPEPYQRWAGTSGVLTTTQKGLRRDSTPASAVSPSRQRDSRGTLTIVRPLSGAVYLIDPTLRREFQTLPLAAEGASPDGVEWFVNDTSVGRAAPDGNLRWPLAVGTHTITARDATGRTATTTITVR
jgi:penicillin-binding protein 1C